MPVFAVVSLVLYGWTFISDFWRLNSWRMNLTAWEIFSLFSYSMVLSFLEAALIMAVLLALSLVFPSKLWKERFLVRGSITALCLLLSMILQLKLREAGVQVGILQSLGQWWLVTCILTVLLVVFLPRYRVVEKMMYELTDRAIVFLYLFLPLTGIGLVILIARVLFTV